ncbi:MAG: hypothetical protein KAJ42_10695, partial [Gemmatimonadetes bacterium]|nr:hypothetical protein [Gemmatimonadota bacterium]
IREPGGGYLARAGGRLSIHGVERAREILCRVTPEGRGGGTGKGEGSRAGSPLAVHCAFTVVLSDHEIPIPTMMFMKIDEVMELDLDFFLSPTPKKGGRRSPPQGSDRRKD